MGFKDTQWATTIPLPMKWKVVLLAICIHTDDRSHVTIAGQRTLADAIGSSVDKVSEALGVLDRLGVISRERRNGHGGYRTSDRITVQTTYTADDLVGEMPTGESANKEISGDLHGDFRSPIPEISGAEEINQIDQPEGQPDNTLDEFDFDEYTHRAPNPDGIEFSTFWAIWPRKAAKLDAVKAWAKATKTTPADVICAAAQAYASSPYLPDKKFIPHAATWLNGHRWEDELPTAPEPERRMTTADRNLAYVASLAQQETHPKGISA